MRRIARGDLKPGDRIPSQRELAEMIHVNPNTTQRAYREMENAGLVETLRGQGTFIRNDLEMVTRIRREMAEAALNVFVREMRQLGFAPDEIVTLVKGACDEEDGKGGGPSGDR